jgi:hypothetical protein
MMSFYKWCIQKYDNTVHFFFTEQLREAKLKHPGRNIALQPITLNIIAQSVKRSEKSVYRSLRRLESAGVMEEVKDGWITKDQEILVRPRVYRL